MKTVASFSKPFEAHLLIARLEANGIRAFARDENLVTLDWLYSNAVGGVKIDVADEDYERALELLETDSPPPAPETIRPKSPARYAVVFLVTWVLSFGYMLAVVQPQESSDLARPLLISVLAAGVAAGVGAFLRL